MINLINFVILVAQMMSCADVCDITRTEAARIVLDNYECGNAAYEDAMHDLPTHEIDVELGAGF